LTVKRKEENMNSNEPNLAWPAQTCVETKRARACSSKFASGPLGIWITNKESLNTIPITHWQLHKRPPIFFFTVLVHDFVPIEYLAADANTHRQWPVLVVLSTQTPSRRLPEQTHGFNLTSSSLNCICSRQRRSKITGVPVPVYPSRSYSIQGLGTNQWPSRTMVLTQTWTKTTRNGRSTWAMSTVALSGDVTVFPRLRRGSV
jgi:hypothetical protein